MGEDLLNYSQMSDNNEYMTQRLPDSFDNSREN